MKNTLCELLDQATILGHRKTNKEIAEYLESCGVIVCRQDELPTADVQPVKRARWIIRKCRMLPYCSACGSEPVAAIMTKHCPNCGALMQEEE